MHVRSTLLVAVLAFAATAAAADDAGERTAAAVRALLAALVTADTTNPPGNEGRAVAIVGRRLDEASIAYETADFAPGRKNLVARLRGSGADEPLLLLAHTDVVGAEGQEWSTDPHVVTEKDGFLFGRGVFDDLGMVALAVETLIRLHESGVTLRREIIVALTGDEESGGDGIRSLLETHPEWIRAEIALNEGGGVVLDDRGEASFVALQMAEKTYQDFELRTSGATGHSSVPMPENAIDRLARALDRLARHHEPPRLLPVTRAYFAARAAVEPPAIAAAMRAVAGAKGKLPPKALAILERDPLLAARLRTTCVATTVRGGTRENALPADAVANVNCRILPDETVDQRRSVLARIIDDPAVEIRVVESFGSGPPSPIDGSVPVAIAQVVHEMWPGIPIIPTMSLGATDSRFLRNAGTAAYGFNPIALTEPDARRAHGIDERIPVASLLTAVELFHRLVLRLAAGEAPAMPSALGGQSPIAAPAGRRRSFAP